MKSVTSRVTSNGVQRGWHRTNPGWIGRCGLRPWARIGITHGSLVLWSGFCGDAGSAAAARAESVRRKAATVCQGADVRIPVYRLQNTQGDGELVEQGTAGQLLACDHARGPA